MHLVDVSMKHNKNLSTKEVDIYMTIYRTACICLGRLSTRVLVCSVTTKKIHVLCIKADKCVLVPNLLLVYHYHCKENNKEFILPYDSLLKIPFVCLLNVFYRMAPLLCAYQHEMGTRKWWNCSLQMEPKSTLLKR